METTSVSLEFAGKKLTFEIGHVAQQATAAVLARQGDTMVLATVVEGNERTDIDYFPLSVEYVERLYAGGKIKGSRWVKREGRPSDEAILTGRLIDRSIRPLFPKEYKKDVQVVVTVLSVDAENQPDILAINAVSAALAISPIPWKGPVSAIRMGVKMEEDGKHTFLSNPTMSEMEMSELDVVSSQTTETTLMIEAGAFQVPESIVAEAIKTGHEENKKMIEFINKLAKKIGQPKIDVKPNTALLETAAIIEKSFKKEVAEHAQARADKEGGGPSIDDLVTAIIDHAKTENPEQELDKKVVAQAIEKVMFKLIRKDVIEKQKRLDGRKIDELRPLSVEVGILPRTHGSAIFSRGATQALTVATLGSPRMSQIIESAEGEEDKRYIHHYSMPPYSVGQTGRMGTPSRREIGHGALAERALEPVIPDGKVFPYTIRVVSEIMSSNGSTSMASTCGSTLALMDAGVPILAPVAGISVGMMSDEEKYVLLTDIIGMEDFSGDMDFKVAGTEKGVTAIQLDVKRPITQQQIEETFVRAKAARTIILEKMTSVIPQYREQVSEYAPKIELIQIPVDKIGEVIGPGGRNIKNIIATTGAEVDVEDDGTVSVSGISEEAVRKASDWIKGMTRDVTPGEVFEGEVKRILPFGAFVEYLPGREGMVHVSKMKRGFVNHPEEVVAIGDKVTVKVEEIDQQGRINLTMILDDNGGNEGGEQPREPRESRGGYNGGGRSGGHGNFDRGNRRNAGPSSDHPLSRQFQREQNEKRGFQRKRFR